MTPLHGPTDAGRETLGQLDLLAGVDDQHTGRAEGVLRRAGLETGLPEEPGLLVGEDAAHRDLGAEHLGALSPKSPSEAIASGRMAIGMPSVSQSSRPSSAIPG